MYTTRHIDELHEWGKNKEFRSITQTNFDKLVSDVHANGVEDDLLIEPDGTILDGNHRYKAVKYLLSQGITQTDTGQDLAMLPVKVVEPQSDGERWRIALRKQSDYAQTTDNVLNFQSEFENFVDLQSLNIQLYEPKTLDELLEGSEDDSKDDTTQNGDDSNKEREVICPHCGRSFTQN